jgi:hypothetical protein
MSAHRRSCGGGAAKLFFMNSIFSHDLSHDQIAQKLGILKTIVKIGKRL